MKEQIEKQAIEKMKVDVLNSVVWKDIDDGVSALDVDCTTENLHSKGYRKQIEGEWIAKREMYRTPTAKNYYCSICEKSAIHDNFMGVSRQTNYCPNCGAKMRREQ